MKNQLKVEITEIFVTKVNKDRCFSGTIKRSRNNKGEMSLFGCITISDGTILCANETDQKILTNNLNSIAIMVLDKGIHNDNGKFINFELTNTIIPFNDIENKFFLN